MKQIETGNAVPGVGDSVGFDERGEMQIAGESLLMSVGRTGLPFDLRLSDYGCGIQLLQSSDSYVNTACEHMVNGDHLRVFIVDDKAYENIYGHDSQPDAVYRSLKQADRGWRHLMDQNIAQSTEPYWFIVKTIPHPEGPDRSNASDLARFRIVPRERVHQVFTEQIIPVTCDKTPLALPFLLRDANLWVGESSRVRIGYNAVVLEGLEGPGNVSFSFEIRQTDNQPVMILYRPERVKVSQGNGTRDITTDDDRATILWGADAICINGVIWSDPRGGYITVPLPQGSARIEFTSRTLSPNRRRIAGFDVTDRGMLVWTDRTEKGKFSFLRQGMGQVIYAYQMAMERNGDEGRVDNAIYDKVSDAGQYNNDINELVRQRSFEAMTLEETLAYNRQQIRRTERVFPGTLIPQPDKGMLADGQASDGTRDVRMVNPLLLCR